MAKNKTQEKHKKTPKIKNKNTNKFNIKKKQPVNKCLNKSKDDVNNVNECHETHNESVLELMTKNPELNQTFEYILYSNKYKHTLTDVFNIIKMLMSKLEELQKNNVDLNNIFDTINMNNKIKGLIQSSTVNLCHVVEQLNVNESNFLNFACNFSTPLVMSNNFENFTENTTTLINNANIEPKEPPKEHLVSRLDLNHPSTPKKIKTEFITSKLSTDIFDRNYTIILSSDDENDESNSFDDRKNQNLAENTQFKDEDLERYVIGSDFIPKYDDSNHDSSQRQSKSSCGPKLSTPVIPVQRNKKIKQTVPDEAVHEARKSDFCIRKRLNERNNEMLNIIKDLNLKLDEIVLEFDLVNKKPLVIIQKELAKVLKKHQIEGIRFVWNSVFETVNRSNTTEGAGCILAHRMGIGKTLQIISLMYSVLSQSQMNIKTFLIICPPGIIYSWMDEIYKWLKDVDKNEIVKVYDLPKTNKLYNITNIATWKSKGGILILSYENFKSLVNCKQNDLREAFSHTLIDPGPDVVVLDEGHYIKNTNTILLKSLSKIKTKRRIVLTGTPIQNSLKEYYTLVDFVKPNLLGSFGDFSSTFIKPIDSGQFFDSSAEAVQVMKQRTFILHRLLQNTIHRIDDKHLKPLFTEKIEYTLEINMTDFQCELYEKFLNYNKTSNDSCCVFLRLHVLTLITLHPLTLYRLLHFKNNKLAEFGTSALNQKIVKDLSWIASYKDDPRFFEANQSNKIIYLMAMINQCEQRDEKILCFLKSPLALDALEYFLQKEKNWSLGEHYFRMDGKTPLNIRNQMCEAFNNPQNSTRLFILSLGTGVLGYNMVGANRVLLLSTSWNPSNDLQAIYRCLRFGQKKTVYVNRLLAKGTVEPKVYYRQISKLGMASSVVDLQHFSRTVSYNQTNDLFTFDSTKHYYKLNPKTKDKSLNCLITNNHKLVSDLKEHDSMLVESVEDQLTIEERKTVWLAFKNKELGNKSLIVSKSQQNNLKSFKQCKTNSQTPKVVENIKQELDDHSEVFTNDLEQEENQTIANEDHDLKHLRFKNTKSNAQPTFLGKHTKLSDDKVVEIPTSLNPELKNNSLNTKQHNRWKNDESIQSQFKHFQRKTFNHHKKNPYSQSNFHPRQFSGIQLAKSVQNQNERLTPNNYVNQTWYPDQQTSTYNNNIQNRSGMSRRLDYSV